MRTDPLNGTDRSNLNGQVDIVQGGYLQTVRHYYDIKEQLTFYVAQFVYFNIISKLIRGSFLELKWFV